MIIVYYVDLHRKLPLNYQTITIVILIVMKILHVLLTRMPVPPPKYGGTERVLWALYLGQKSLGHEVKFLTKSVNNHPDSITFDHSKSLESQVEGWADIIHFHFLFEGDIKTPYVCTLHNQFYEQQSLPQNIIFLGQRHAERTGGSAFVYNGLYWDDYGKPNLNPSSNYIHFLANAKYRDKNLKDAVIIARQAKKELHALGSRRFSLRWKKDGSYRPYFYAGKDLNFHGMVGGEYKNEIIRNSQALVFPVLIHEAFGLAMIESLYLGCPVIGSHHGSVPEIIIPEVGLSTSSKSEMVEALKNINQFSRKTCHEYARDHFNHIVMSQKYVKYYEQVTNGHPLHDKRIDSKGNLSRDLRLEA